jgi:hypothetical protein
MENNTSDYIQYHHDLIKEIFRKKAEFHRRQAQLPIEEKIKILVELQKIALTIRPNQGEDDLRRVWELD